MSANQKKLRCAVYTRKSTEEGLDQEFNSLHAQREACIAFIASQAGLGWRLATDQYDDSGISGGTMERPALQRLLQDIRDRKVDVVVVYKIDRLTRSLMDFSKIVEVFDANDVSFVAVTQQFNTTTSMGRLTLNVLLSFAQFEREVTAERIRDKIAASRRKGMWMGGSVPFGYQAIDKKLVVDDDAADTVRSIFKRYLDLRSVFALVDALNADVQAEHNSPESNPARRSTYSRGMVYHMLTNPVYIGKARHKDRLYDGEHEAIVDDETFAAVQTLLKDQTPTRRKGTSSRSLHLLTGLLYDDAGDRLSPVFTVKDGKRYRYYISSRLERARRKDASGWRLPAEELERTVLHQLDLMLRDEVRLSEWAQTLTSSLPMHDLVSRAATLRTRLQTSLIGECTKLLRPILHRITVKPGAMVLDLNPVALIDAVRGLHESEQGRGTPEPSAFFAVSVPMTLRRRGCEARIVIANPSQSRRPDEGLVKTLAKAHVLLGMLNDGSDRTIANVAEAVGIHIADVSRILPLAFVAPRITDAILRGRQPVELTARSLMRDELPAMWSDQLRKLGM